jgi:hypothetical protein
MWAKALMPKGVEMNLQEKLEHWTKLGQTVLATIIDEPFTSYLKIAQRHGCSLAYVAHVAAINRITRPVGRHRRKHVCMACGVPVTN